jgi:ABC-2 type transport system permease protein
MDYGAYLLPGMLTMTVLFSSIFGAMSLIQDRHEGFLQSVLVSPTPRWAIAASKLLGSSIIATLQALCLLPAAFLLGDGIGLPGAGLAAVALLCTAIGIAGLGLACAWWVDSTQGFHGVMNLILLPMWLLSGSVFPLAGASGWMKLIMMANPVTWCTTVLHNALGHDAGDPVIAWAVTIGFACFGIALGWTTLGRGIRRF